MTYISYIQLLILCVRLQPLQTTQCIFGATMNKVTSNSIYLVILKQKDRKKYAYILYYTMNLQNRNKNNVEKNTKN